MGIWGSMAGYGPSQSPVNVKIPILRCAIEKIFRGRVKSVC